MKILITTTYYLPNVSGITIYIKILAEEMVKLGHEVTILTSWHDPKTKKEEVINGVKIKRLKIWFKIGKGPIYPGLIGSSIKEIRRCQAVNCHLPQPESVWLGLVAKIFGKKLILSHHTDLSFWKGIKNKIIDGGVFVCQVGSGLLADKIISYTNDYARNSYYLKLFLRKVKQIYPPIKLENKINLTLTKKINKAIYGKKYVIGFCGRIAKQKGIELLIQSTKLLDKNLGKNNYVILMAGPIKVIGENYYEYLQNKYRKILKEKFVFLGNIERSELSNFYKKIDLLVLPSDDILESFGWVQIEAMKCGTPGVATDLPGMRIPIKITKMGELFENKNVTDLADKIELVLKKGKKFYQKRAGNNLNKFDYQKSIREYEKIFRN
ncbi:MAG TPA: glycosyltransferase family 4 protein [Candidatus Woesebacteria bacterium]|nr:glycosyltransferase family 4 protein [Candidatus Shapirobacteria bacterium]HOR02220.1 glycosyltransferase family 4 protein [Candidatus Woesebacteria bacterium]